MKGSSSAKQGTEHPDADHTFLINANIRHGTHKAGIDCPALASASPHPCSAQPLLVRALTLASAIVQCLRVQPIIASLRVSLELQKTPPSGSARMAFRMKPGAEGGNQQSCEDLGTWKSVVCDEGRGCFSSHLPGARDKELCRDFFAAAEGKTLWCRPRSRAGPMPRSTAWMTSNGCACNYAYGGISVAPQPFPEWLEDLMTIVMPLCGITERCHWPDSCNLNLYPDGAGSIGWHSDDEPLFQGKHEDIVIISLSLG
jgi:hypothetical protein